MSTAKRVWINTGITAAIGDHCCYNNQHKQLMGETRCGGWGGGGGSDCFLLFCFVFFFWLFFFVYFLGGRGGSRERGI